ncbi:MAG TPA: hypothetical protein VGB14_09480 [Acidimicrobiales bacterium]|jgi:hypothetical protein
MAQDGERPIAIVDIDGVVADVRHRVHHVRRRPKDWDAFFAAAAADPPHPEGIALVQRLAEDHDVVYLTGRPVHLKGDTEAWLDRHGIGGHRLLMRRAGDRRPAAAVKVGILRDLARRREVAIVVDDDPVVVAAVREAGWPVFHADWEERAAEDERSLRAAQEAEGRT